MYKVKSTLVFLIILGTIGNTQAQLGIKAGISFSGLLSSNEGDFRPFLGHEVEWIQYGESKPAIGMHFGTYYTFSVSNFFDLQPEINFVQRGYLFDHTTLYDARYCIKISYLEFPITLRYELPIFELVKLDLYTGPFAAVKLSANGQLEFEGKKDVKKLTSVNNIDYGIIIGIDSEIDIGKEKLLFDFRFNWGLNNIMSQPAEYINLYNDPGTVRNLSFTFTTGYSL